MPAPRKREWGTSSVIKVFSRKKKRLLEISYTFNGLGEGGMGIHFWSTKSEGEVGYKNAANPTKKKAVAIILYPLWFRSLGCYTR